MVDAIKHFGQVTQDVTDSVRCILSVRVKSVLWIFTSLKSNCSTARILILNVDPISWALFSLHLLTRLLVMILVCIYFSCFSLCMNGPYNWKFSPFRKALVNNYICELKVYLYSLHSILKFYWIFHHILLNFWLKRFIISLNCISETGITFISVVQLSKYETSTRFVAIWNTHTSNPDL